MNKFAHLILIFSLSLFLFLLGSAQALADTSYRVQNSSQGGTFTLPNPLRATNIAQIITNIAYYLSVYIAPPIVTLMILFAAFQILTAGDNPEKLTSAKNMILWTVVGYVIILIAWGVTSIIHQLLSS